MTSISVANEKLTTDKVEKDITEIKKEWISNPLTCYSQIGKISYSNCMENNKGENCQINTIKNITNVCEIPTQKYLLNKYKSTHPELKEKKINEMPKEFTEYFNKEKKIYQIQIVYFAGFEAGYYTAIKNYQTLKKKAFLIKQKSDKMKIKTIEK